MIFSGQDEYWVQVREIDRIRNSLSGSEILITGGAGAIGGQLVRSIQYISGAGCSITVLDDFSSYSDFHLAKQQVPPGVRLIHGSIEDDAALRSAFQNRPNFVFHLAAFFANQRSIDYPDRAVSTDIVGLQKVLSMASISQVKRFVFASSRTLYGNIDDVGSTEQDIDTKFTTPYQINKFVGEIYANYFRTTFELPTTTCRIFNSYGPGELPGKYRNVIPNFVARAILGYPLQITGTGNESRDFTFVLDIVQGLLLAAVVPEAEGGAFNIGYGQQVAIEELANMILNKTNSRSVIVHGDRRKWDAKVRTLSDTNLAKSVLGFEPVVPIQSGLDETISWFTCNWEEHHKAFHSCIGD